MKLLQSTRFRMTGSAMVLALGAGVAFALLTAEPAYACSSGGGYGSSFDFFGGLFGR